MKKASAYFHLAKFASVSTVRRVFGIVAMITSLNAGAQTLDEYLRQAVRDNPGLKAMRSEYEASVQGIAQAKGLDDPMLSVSAFGEMVETANGEQMVTISVEQQFPWFGTLNAKGEVAASMAEASLKKYQVAQNELLFEVKSAYYPIYEAARLAALNREQLAILETYKSLATARFRNGKGPMVDVIRIEIMMDQIATEIKVLERRRRSLESAFNALLNKDAGLPVAVPDTLALPAVSAEVWRDSIRRNPQLGVNDELLAAAQAREKLARKEGMPKLGLGFNYIVIDPMPGMEHPRNGKDAYMPMLSVSLPIYRKKYKAAEKEAQLMQAYYRASREEGLNNLAGEFARAAAAIENSYEQYQSLHHHAMLVNRAIRLLLSAVETSDTGYEEVLRMQQELLMHESERVKVVVESWQAVAKLEYLTTRQP